MRHRPRLLTACLALTALAATCALSAKTEADFDSLLSAVKTYEYGQSRAALFALEQAVQKGAGDDAARESMASKMAALLTAEATADCKKHLCAQISLIGSAKQVPVLASLLADKELGLAARSALERTPGKDAVVAMRTALSKSSDRIALGLMDTLGKRGDSAAAGMIAGFLRDKDPVVASGAAAALGKIGGKEATERLIQADAGVAAGVRLAVSQALLECADGLVQGGDTTQAAKVYEKLSGPGRPAHVKIAAFPGAIASRGKDGASLVLNALAGDDPAMRSAAIRALRTFGGKEIITAVVSKLDGLAPEAQVQIVNALANRGDSAALPGIQRLLRSGQAGVKTAAVEALGTLGDASTVAVLAGFLADAELGKAAARSLTRIEGAGVDKAMIALLEKGSAAEKAGIAAVLRERSAKGAAPALLKAAADNDAEVRKAALKAIAALATVSECDGLIRLLGRPDSAGDTRNIQSALVMLCARDASARDIVAKAADRAAGPAGVSLLPILGKTGGDRALGVLKGAMRDGDKDVRTTAVKAIAEWPTAEPLPMLVAFLRAEKEMTPKALAFRAFVALSGRDSAPLPDELAGLYKELMASADRPEDRKTLFGGLGNVASPGALKLAASSLGDSATVNEAALAVVQIAPHLLASHGKDVKAAVTAALAACELATVKTKAKDILFQLSKPVNIARAATASSPDGLEKDGNAGGDQAAIDGDPNTYWDEVDRKKLYVLRLDFKRAVTANAISIMGFQHHGYAPRDFDIVCDGKTVKKVLDAGYKDNLLRVDIPTTTFNSLELRITRSYGPSPAIRELEVYAPEEG